MCKLLCLFRLSKVTVLLPVDSDLDFAYTILIYLYDYINNYKVKGNKAVKRNKQKQNTPKHYKNWACSSCSCDKVLDVW